MTMNKISSDYDQIKGFLSKIRKIQSTVKSSNYGIIREQDFSSDNLENPNNQNDERSNNDSSEEQTDIAVINNVEIEIHSEDPEDLELSDNEKSQISQLIDDFRTEVSEIAEFDRLHIYNESSKLDGKIGDIGINFSLSTGDDTGLYISNPSMLKIDERSMDIINKLRTFSPKFSNTINELLLNRSST